MMKFRECSFDAAKRFIPGPVRRWPSNDNRLASTSYGSVRVISLDHGNIESLVFSLEETLHVAIHKKALD